MIIKIPKMRTSLLINYENTVVALAVVYFLETIYLVTLYPVVETALKMVQFILLGCIGVIFCVQRISVSNMVIRLVIIITFALSFAFSGTYPFLKYGLVLLAGVNCDMSRLCRRILKTYTICIALAFLMSVVGVLPYLIVRRGYSTYGFVHINTMAQYLMSVLCCYLIVYEHKLTWKQWIIAVCLIVVTGYLTDSRTTIASMLFLMLLLAAVKIYPRGFCPGHLAYYTVIILPAVIMIFSLLLSWNFDINNSVFVKIDELLNGRLGTANNLATLLRVTSFGQKLTITATENAYLVGLYQFGLLPMLVEMGVYTYAIRKNIKNQSFGEVICLAVFAIHGFAEVSTFNPYINIALLSAFNKSEGAHHGYKRKGLLK